MPPSSRPSPKKTDFPIVGVGASAGGLEAFTELLGELAPDTGMGFVLVQHLDPTRPSSLSDLLAKATPLPVREVTNSLRVEPNQVYVIPPNAELSVEKGVLKLRSRPRTAGAHLSVDSFFESLAQDQHERAIGIILSGTASDGTQGMEAIKAAGGITFAQDASAKYDSMPRSAAAAGCVDFVLSPAQIAQELARIARHPYVMPAPKKTPRRPASDGAASDTRTQGQTGAESGLKSVLVLLRNRSGADFSVYKSSTIERRIARRMLLNRFETIEAYARFLRGNTEELEALNSDLLISVTSFFRNSEAFEFLRRKVFPKILQGRGDMPIRLWVPGCSTGQEAYSLAIALTEYLDRISHPPKLQIFGTDLNEHLLDVARSGLYSKNLVHGLTAIQLRRFFNEEDGGYRICKSLRQVVTFARHNILSDPPFSHMDLISCRNLLIYIDESMQRKLIPAFHFGLKPGGYLFLGAAEGVGGFTSLFAPLDRRYKIYSRKAGQSPAPGIRLSSRRPIGAKSGAVVRAPEAQAYQVEANVLREADRLALSRYAPTGVLVDADLKVLQFRGDTSRYLKMPTGRASFNLLDMACEGLMLPLRAALKQAKKGGKVARKDGVEVRHNGRKQVLGLEVVPLTHLKDRSYLIFFESAKEAGGAPVPRKTPALTRLAKREESARVKALESELAGTRDYLQSLQEQHEAAHEELQASNEEVTSANEELQSINEELETSKEELESANEELTTVNDEMAGRNAELSLLAGDLANLQNATRLAIVLLGRDLTIRRFSAQAGKQLGLMASDLGQPISILRHALVVPESGVDGFSAPQVPSDRLKKPFDVEAFVTEVVETGRERECEMRDERGNWYSLRVHPYIASERKVEGAVMVLVDITTLKRIERAIAGARVYAENIVDTVSEPLLVLNDQLCVESANRSFYRKFQVEPAETVGKSLFELGDRQWDLPRLRVLLDEVLPRHRIIQNFEVEADFGPIGRRSMVLAARRIDDPTWRTHRILLAIDDVTEKRRLQDEVENARFVESIVRAVRDPILILNADLTVHAANEKFYAAFRESPEKSIGRLVYDLGNGQWNNTRLRRLLEEVLPRKSSFDNFELTHEFENIGKRTMLLNAGPLDPASTASSKIIVGIQDITELLHFQTAVRRSEQRYRQVFENAQVGMLILDPATRKVLDANPSAAELFNSTRGELVGNELSEIGLPFSGDAGTALFRELREVGIVRRDGLPVHSRTGRSLHVEMIGKLYDEEGTTTALCSLREIAGHPSE